MRGLGSGGTRAHRSTEIPSPNGLVSPRPRLVAKTPVREIHLFDGDDSLQHNAFRSPGAPSIEELRQAPKKVTYFKNLYSKMHRGIVPHEYYIDESNVEQLREMEFVFLCGASTKRAIVEALETFGVSFIDVGMGLYLTDASISGVLRVTTNTPSQRTQVKSGNRIPFSELSAGAREGRYLKISDSTI